MARKDDFEYAIVNEPGRLHATVDQLERILTAERARPRSTPASTEP
jgi:hypothetical protein